MPVSVLVSPVFWWHFKCASQDLKWRLAYLCSSGLLWKARKINARTGDQEKVNVLERQDLGHRKVLRPRLLTKARNACSERTYKQTKQPYTLFLKARPLHSPDCDQCHCSGVDAFMKIEDAPEIEATSLSLIYLTWDWLYKFDEFFLFWIFPHLQDNKKSHGFFFWTQSPEITVACAVKDCGLCC